MNNYSGEIKFKICCPCLLGTEGIAAYEIKSLGGKNVQVENGRVILEGSPEMVARLNICSRYVLRVQVLLASFRATSFEELFNGVNKLNWSVWIGKKDKFPVKGSCLSSNLHSVPDCQKIIKKAVVKNLCEKYSVDWFEETAELYQIQFLILKDNVSIMLDTSGDSLYKRGYKASSLDAPIKETLAAVLCDIARVRENHTVIDPFCGSGTILIEAAMKALNMPAGMNRRFTSEQWRQVPKAVWDDEREAARGRIIKDAEFKGFGYDIDEEAVQLSKENALKAGVGEYLHFERRSIENFSEPHDRMSVICNPPYGERLLDIEQAHSIYKVMGERFLPKVGRSYVIITPDEEFEKIFGRKADKRRKLYNGMIKCTAYSYFKSE